MGVGEITLFLVIMIDYPLDFMLVFCYFCLQLEQWLNTPPPSLSLTHTRRIHMGKWVILEVLYSNPPTLTIIWRTTSNRSFLPFISFRKLDTVKRSRFEEYQNINCFSYHICFCIDLASIKAREFVAQQLYHRYQEKLASFHGKILCLS